MGILLEAQMTVKMVGALFNFNMLFETNMFNKLFFTSLDIH